MAIDDGERNFEKALARELRADALNGLHCPDAERLAAYHERMLSPEEMVTQKSHIAGCARCQEILATLEETEVVAISERDSEDAVAPASRPVQPTALAAEATSAANASAAKRKSITEISKRKTYLRWVAPAGAIAAGLLVWIAIKNNSAPMTRSQSKSVEVAENRETGKSDLGAPKPAVREALPRPAAADKDSAKFQGNEKQELDAVVSGDQPTAPTRGRASGAARYEHGPRLTQNQTQNQIQNNGQMAGQNDASGAFDKKVNEPPLAGRNVDGSAGVGNAAGRSEMMTKSAPAAPAAAPSPSRSQGYGAGDGAAPAATTNAAAANARKDEAVRSTTETVEVTPAAPMVDAEEKEAGNDKLALKKAKAADSLGMVIGGKLRDSRVGGLTMIATPDPKVFWIVTQSGTVLKTDDDEKTVRQQKTGEGIKVLAGSAVNKKICWLIAEKGIVLRTTDGGKHWATSNAPGGTNFTTIKAVSATEATITDTNGKVSYSTVDGGATWSVVARP